MSAELNDLAKEAFVGKMLSSMAKSNKGGLGRMANKALGETAIKNHQKANRLIRDTPGGFTSLKGKTKDFVSKNMSAPQLSGTQQRLRQNAGLGRYYSDRTGADVMF